MMKKKKQKTIFLLEHRLRRIGLDGASLAPDLIGLGSFLLALWLPKFETMACIGFGVPVEVFMPCGGESCLVHDDV